MARVKLKQSIHARGSLANLQRGFHFGLRRDNFSNIQQDKVSVCHTSFKLQAFEDS
jgi:hypothetical protein